MSTSPEGIMELHAKPVRLAPRRLAAGIAVLALVWPLGAVADCVDTRKASAAEVDFHKRAMAALVAALPPVPVGGKLQNKDSVTTLGQQCQGMTGDFSLEAARYYELNYRKAIVTVAINATKLPVTDTTPFGAYGAASPKRSEGLKVNNVVWQISGSDSPLRQALADSIDRTRLQALVGKPLPSVAESEALAAQAVPASITETQAAQPAVPSPNVANTQTAMQPVPPPNPALPAAPAQAQSADTVKDAVDTVNKLRGLFGR